MKIILSPAKSLDFEKPLPTHYYTQPFFIKEAITIHKVLKRKSPEELASLMAISKKLSDLNWERNQTWAVPFTPENARPALYAFNGDVYHGLDAYTISQEKLPILQEKLRILSGLYGLLKPLDLILPYRLEMGTKLPIGTKKDLYDFWRPKVTRILQEELKKSTLFINLASTEYSTAINMKALKIPVITPEFRDYKDGTLKMISFFAKKARGMMVRYIIETQAETLDDIKKFDREGYRFDASLSKGNTLVFTR